MNKILYAAVLMFAFCAIQARQYGYKKTKKKPPVVVPNKQLPLCHIPCTRQFIAPECRQETYGLENGQKCKGCDRDICINNFPIRGDNMDFNNWQDNSWQNGGNWINDGPFVGQGRIRDNSGFVDSFQGAILNRGQDQIFGNNLGNGFNSGFVSNNQFGNQFGNTWQ